MDTTHSPAPSPADAPATTHTAPVGDGTVAQLGTTVCVWAHPDDESYLSGGLMAALRDAGQRVVCVTATRGEVGDSSGALDREVLGKVRERELSAALVALGVVEHLWLG